MRSAPAVPGVRPSGLVVTYCAAQSPHDQYYFAQPEGDGSGIVRPPALDLANRDLFERHFTRSGWRNRAGAERRHSACPRSDAAAGLPVQEEIADASCGT